MARGGLGLCTPCHYDGVHNAYVQVKGYKRFVILSPDAWRGLYVFPKLHPSSRQTQVDWAQWPSDDADSGGFDGDDGDDDIDPREEFPEFQRLIDEGSFVEGVGRTPPLPDPNPDPNPPRLPPRLPRRLTQLPLGSAMHVTLGPGDMLYIPPFYFHQVCVPEEAPDGGESVVSMSVSTHTEVNETARAARAGAPFFFASIRARARVLT